MLPGPAVLAGAAAVRLSRRRSRHEFRTAPSSALPAAAIPARSDHTVDARTTREVSPTGSSRAASVRRSMPLHGWRRPPCVRPRQKPTRRRRSSSLSDHRRSVSWSHMAQPGVSGCCATLSSICFSSRDPSRHTRQSRPPCPAAPSPQPKPNGVPAKSSKVTTHRRVRFKARRQRHGPPDVQRRRRAAPRGCDLPGTHP